VEVGPSLAAGNTVVMKPAEQTPLTTLKLARIAADIFPPGVLNIVVGRGESVGNALINHPKVAMISLTGDIATGKKVLTAAAKSVKRTHLELGCKAPVIVFDDADVKAVVEGVRMYGYYNAGQDCTAACRIYAGAKVYDRLVADLSGAASSIAFADSDDAKNEIGPLISQRQRERVASFVERASELKHVEITAGGRRAAGKGFFYEPTGGRRRAAGGRDRAARGLRAGGVGDALHGSRGRDRLGERLRLRACLIGVDQGCRQGDGDRRAAAIWLHVDQLPFHAVQ
jgi:aminobutyraldehyde dehydrogenase